MALKHPGRHPCCGVVSDGCCDVSEPRGTAFEMSAALPPPSRLDAVMGPAPRAVKVAVPR